jgi:hypothetical protein
LDELLSRRGAQVGSEPVEVYALCLELKPDRLGPSRAKPSRASCLRLRRLSWVPSGSRTSHSTPQSRCRRPIPFWSAKASDYLRGYFHAAALAQYDLRAVAAWVSGADPDVPERILAAAGAHQWALTLAELRSEAHKTAATVRMVMSRALAFMADPALAACVLPAPARGSISPPSCTTPAPCT